MIPLYYNIYTPHIHPKLLQVLRCIYGSAVSGWKYEENAEWAF